jgi:hypothetical protein
MHSDDVSDRQVDMAKELADWAIRTTDLDGMSQASYERIHVMFRDICSDLEMVDDDGDPVLSACTQSELCVFIHLMCRTWTSTPYLWSILCSYTGIQTQRELFERNPKRLLEVLVWAYTLESGVQYMDADPGQTDRIVQGWKDRIQAGGGSTFLVTKRASLFGSKDIPMDNDKFALSLNLNVLEACISDLTQGNLTNARNGLALVGNLFNRSIIRTSGAGHRTPDLVLDNDWIRLYMGWNLAFCCSFNQPEVMMKLLIPSVAVGSGPNWLRHRLYALRMTIMSQYFEKVPQNWDMDDLREHLTKQSVWLRSVQGRSQARVSRCRWVQEVPTAVLVRCVRSLLYVVQWLEF